MVPHVIRFRAISFVCVVFICFPLHAQTQTDRTNFELNTVLMLSTFKIEGRTATGQPTIGTAFIVGRALDKPPANDPYAARYVLVTAAHVLEEMQGETATLHLRRKVDANTWVRVPHPVPIRASGQPLWKKHPDADVAVMYVALPPDDSRVIAMTDVLADDNLLANLEIHPGDDLECLGFPFGQESNDAGFPVLRSGKIASYPLLPTNKTKTFLLDLRVFKGNSGGPVYLIESNRWTKNSGMKLGYTIHAILGLVSQERVLPQIITGPYSEEIRRYQLDLAVVVHASLIKQAIDLLPPPDITH